MLKTRIAVIGAGDISRFYLENLTKLIPQIEVEGIYSRTAERALAQAEKFGIPRVYGTLEELLCDPVPSIVLNLTPPPQHFELSMRCLQAGKHVYTEKAMAATLEQGRLLLETAKKHALSICGAPDTFLAASFQTLRKLVDDGCIGKVTGAHVSIVNSGHERWHANPAFFYQVGGGPMLDMGVYPLTALVNVFGSVEAVAGMCGAAFSERTIATQPLFGDKINVETPTHVMGLIRFACGVPVTVTASFDGCARVPAPMEIYGTKGMLKLSAFGGPVSMLNTESGQFCEMPMLFAYKEHVHGLGLADQATALIKGRKPRCSGELILHVLEIMTAFERSSNAGAFVSIESRVERPAPMTDPELPFVLD
jgi:predicted dehydrogenase